MTVRCSYCGRGYQIDPALCTACGLIGTCRAVAPPPRELPSILSVGMDTIDRELLHGGLRPGVYLLAGPPGIGKSTLASQWIAHTGGAYLATEEAEAQVRERIARVSSVAEARAVRVIETGDRMDLAGAVRVAGMVPLLVVDSLDGMGGGSDARKLQLVQGLADWAKALKRPVVALSHVNKGGAVLGRRSVEHAVNATLDFSGEREAIERRLTASKSRFGQTAGRACDLAMTSRGLAEGVALYQLAVDRGTEPRVGSVLCPANGPRGLALVEIEALAQRSGGSAGKVHAEGLDVARVRKVLASVGAVLGLSETLSARTITVAATLPGFTGTDAHITGPTDAAVAVAVLSALRSWDLPALCCAWGSVTLSGDVRGDALDADRERLCAQLEGAVVAGPSDAPTLRKLAELVGIPADAAIDVDTEEPRKRHEAAHEPRQRSLLTSP